MKAIQAQIHFWNKPVLSNKGKVSYSRKQQGACCDSNWRL